MRARRFQKIICLSLSCFVQNLIAAEKIPDVTVKAPKNYPQQFPYFGQTITKEDIKRSSAIHPTDLLKNKALLQTRDSTGNGASFEASLRGFGSNAAANTLVIVDGIRQNGYDLMPPSLSSQRGRVNGYVISEKKSIFKLFILLRGYFFLSLEAGDS